MATPQTEAEDLPAWGDARENGEWEPALKIEDNEDHESPFPANEVINSKIALW
jgi:hypothetical protein